MRLADTLEEFSSALIVSKTLFLGAEFRRMCLQSAGSGAQRMLHMQHFVVEDEFHRVGRDVSAIQPLVHHDLIEGRIIAPKLRAPVARAPSQARPPKASLEVFAIKRDEQGIQIMRRAQRIVLDSPRALSPNACDVPPRRMSQRELPIKIAQLARHAAA